MFKKNEDGTVTIAVKIVDQPDQNRMVWPKEMMVKAVEEFNTRRVDGEVKYGELNPSSKRNSLNGPINEAAVIYLENVSHSVSDLRVEKSRRGNDNCNFLFANITFQGPLGGMLEGLMASPENKIAFTIRGYYSSNDEKVISDLHLVTIDAVLKG